jgi:hypothetical protein
MTPPDSEIKKATRQWLEKAANDLRAGRIVLDHDASLGGVAAFHAQQAAEGRFSVFRFPRSGL